MCNRNGADARVFIVPTDRVQQTDIDRTLGDTALLFTPVHLRTTTCAAAANTRRVLHPAARYEGRVGNFSSAQKPENGLSWSIHIEILDLIE